MNTEQLLQLATNAAWLCVSLIAYFLGRIIGTSRGYTLARNDFRLFLGAVLLKSRRNKNPNLFFFKKIKAAKNA